MTKVHEYRGAKFNIVVEFGQLVFRPHGYRCNIITITRIVDNLVVWSYEVLEEDKTVLSILQGIDIINSKIDTGLLLAPTKVQESLMSIGFKSTDEVNS